MVPDLLNPRRETLAAAVTERFSCHQFCASPSLADWSALTYLTGRWERSGIHLRMTRVPSGFFSGSILRFDKIAGTDAVCVLSGPNDPQSLISAGFLGEAFVLECTALSLSTCWLTGSLLRRPLPLKLSSDEAVFALIAVGHSKEMQPPRRRKEMEKLCQGNYASWRLPFQKAAQYVREAPSSSNAQPFLMHADDQHFCIDSGDRYRLDLGAAICHASLALDMPHQWTLSGSHHAPMAVCECSF